MAISTGLFLLLGLLGQPWAGAAADSQAVVCEGTACYTAHWGKLSAAEAQHRCNENGGNLATVKSEEEARHVQQALTQLLKTKAPLEAKMGKFWIGLQREKGNCKEEKSPIHSHLFASSSRASRPQKAQDYNIIPETAKTLGADGFSWMRRKQQDHWIRACYSPTLPLLASCFLLLTK